MKYECLCTWIFFALKLLAFDCVMSEKLKLLLFISLSLFCTVFPCTLVLQKKELLLVCYFLGVEIGKGKMGERIFKALFSIVI
jgi:hypothetical protein